MITYTYEAKFALNTLSPQDQLRIREIETKLDCPLEELVASGFVKKMEMPGDLFLARAGDSLRVIFEPTTEGARILDIVRHERLVEFHRALHAGAEA